MKICPCCKINKSLLDFYADEKRKTGYSSWCKICISKKASERHRLYPEQSVAKDITKILNISLKEAIELIKNILITKKYECAICGFNNKLNIDHCHATGRVRGWLCGPCNRGIGMFKEDIQRMRNAIDYIVSHCITNEEK